MYKTDFKYFLKENGVVTGDIALKLYNKKQEIYGNGIYKGVGLGKFS